MRKALPLAVAWIAGAALFGFLLSVIPSPQQPGVFWVSNLSSPWLAVAFFAGTSQRSVRSAAFVGALTDIACVVGFYYHFLLVGDVGVPAGHGSPILTRITGNVAHWAAFVSPWVAFAVVAGALFGALGLAWRNSRSRVSGIALGAAFALEPIAWYARNGGLESPVGIWLAEFVFGLAVIAVMLVSGRRLPTE